MGQARKEGKKRGWSPLHLGVYVGLTMPFIGSASEPGSTTPKGNRSESMRRRAFPIILSGLKTPGGRRMTEDFMYCRGEDVLGNTEGAGGPELLRWKGLYSREQV